MIIRLCRYEVKMELYIF